MLTSGSDYFTVQGTRALDGGVTVGGSSGVPEPANLDDAGY
jgi:hypothetical protein